MKHKMTTEARLRAGMAIVVILSLCLAMTTYALMTVTLKITNNEFRTGAVQITLMKNGEVLTDQSQIVNISNAEPGMLIDETFSIVNRPQTAANPEGSTGAIFYRLSFENVTGELAEIMEVTITAEEPNELPQLRPGQDAATFFPEGDRRHGRIEGTIIYHGTIAELRSNQGNLNSAPNDRIELNDERKIHMYFYFPTEAGNEYMEARAGFDFKAEAIQSKNYEDYIR